MSYSYDYLENGMWLLMRTLFSMPTLMGIAAYVLTALALAFTDEGFWLAAQLLLLAHLPVMLAEGLVTMFTVSFIMRVRPELLGMAPVQPDNGQEDA